MGFRLLTEYYSFLSTILDNEFNTLPYNCFRLLTEYYSFLLKSDSRFIVDYCESFRLLTEYHSFLFNCYIYIFHKKVVESFRLLTEYHSFLFRGCN